MNRSSLFEVTLDKASTDLFGMNHIIGFMPKPLLSQAVVLMKMGLKQRDVHGDRE
jgi:hypothetical protein